MEERCNHDAVTFIFFSPLLNERFFLTRKSTMENQPVLQLKSSTRFSQIVSYSAIQGMQ